MHTTHEDNMAPWVKVLKGEGDIPCDYMVVGDHPTKDDNKHGRVFAGRVARDLFSRYLNGLRLPSRDDVYLTYLHKDFNPAGEYTTADDQKDGEVLRAEVATVDPSLIIAFGREPSRFFLGDVDLDEVNGLPWEKDGRVIFPMYSPGQALFSPELQSQIAYGFGQLELYLAGTLKSRTLYDDPYPDPIYVEVTTEAFLNSWFSTITTDSEVHIDTEGYPHAPWSIQFSTVPGTGYLIRQSRPDLVRTFGVWLRRVRPRITYHNSLHELAIFRSMGIQVNDLPFDDTMVMAYLLQLEPQGLKPLSTRHCNMRMQSYDEVMGTAGDELAIEYLLSLHDLEEFDWQARNEAEFIKLLEAGKRVTKIKEQPKTALHKSLIRCLRSDRPRGLWMDQIEDIHVAAYTRLGSMDEPSLDYVDAGTAVHYGCRDADATGRVKPELSKRLDALGLRRVYELELGTYPLIDRMHHIGLLPDLDHFATLSEKLGGEIAGIQSRLVEQTGKADFNANSFIQVGDLLFDTLALPAIKKTSEGRASTNDKILEALEHEHGTRHPVISTIREYREVYKLKHTFVDRIPDFVRRWPHDGRVHSTFRTTRVVTGRLAASDPNVLAMPKHGKFAKDFRRGWVAAPGHVIASWDLSQIELRILAHLSQDPVLLAAFRTGVDLHATLAQRIFGVDPKNQDKSKHRLPAKAVNFGIPMGMQAQGLSLELRKNGLDIDEDDAQKWLDETNQLYKEVPKYKQQKIAEARRNGFVRCLSGRIRYVGGIRSFDKRIQAESERFAFSTPIQEGAQWCMKQAEAAVWNDVILPYQAAGHWIEPLVQIHDDLTLEMEEGLEKVVNPLMIHCMCAVPEQLSVPIETSGDAGYNLAEQKEIA